ncbi:hypothetical protein [Hydrogenophaga sp.]|uniref:hypothetical protein n=1 Tax=Hydrogenophaga sp. TaxID=1904254 RepID=UPI0025BBDA3B|nr:hypothetical protein [Hydrogenophaga sp.]MBT9462537.1 hypothetical protein [Hydrogenophaga sp.]
MPSKPTNPRTQKSLGINKLPATLTPNPRTPAGQGELFIDKQLEINGIGMGVLSDGTAFLTGRGLAGLCGIDSSRVSELAQSWNSQAPNPLARAVKKILADKGIFVATPYVEIRQAGEFFHAYSDVVCLAVLEYHAFDKPTDDAKKNFRLLAGKALHDFIYTQVGYDPQNHVPEVWRQFHDRVSLVYNSVPNGYFSIFKEISDMIVHLGQQGLMIDSNFVPDISVGIGWGKHWTGGKSDAKYGARINYEHNYPDYFPQAMSNPQKPWCYPDAALGEFRRWFRETYVGEGKFENYLNSKVRDRALPASFAQIALSAYKDPKGIGRN